MYRVCALKLQLHLAALVCIPVISRLLILSYTILYSQNLKKQRAFGIFGARSRLAAVFHIAASGLLPKPSVANYQSATWIAGRVFFSVFFSFWILEYFINFKLSRPFQTSTIRTLPPVLPWFSKFWNSAIFYKVCRPTSLSDSLMAKLHGTRVD